MDEDSSNSEDMAEDLIDAIDEEADDDDDVEDGLTQREREIEVSRESERQRKAQELKKQLRKRQLGMLTYRWPAIVLVLGGLLAISTEFLQIMVREPGVPPEIGFDTYFAAVFKTGGGVFFLSPLILGIFMIVLSYFAYRNPKATWLALIPAALLVMSGGFVFFLITFAITVQPHLEGLIYVTPAALSMIIAGVISLLAIALKEKED